MTRLLAFFAFLPGMALAHPGHLADVAGHDHLVAGVAIGVAIGVAVWGALRGRKDEEVSDETDEAADSETQEA
ncbi:DUF6732 family protein [Maritimibacter sp. UBA3975]|uniref:DUF6732 family protein n=1 Tax=Maritimibacter sp. UBA3975 TaxID=1946833 RepID=UPI000C0A516E|nr:DUF6732 family protein [Maritimibacter sp. UBA3975]MAM61907.1 hypothetical protein [Maritimibacter sp.]